MNSPAAFSLNTRQVYRRVRLYGLITSPVIVGAFLILLLATIGLVLTLVFGAPSEALLGITLMSAAGTGALLLVFTFGSTFYPYQKPSATTTQLLTNSTTERNVAQAFDWSVLQRVGGLFARDEVDLVAVLERVLSSAQVKQFLRRFEFSREDTVKAITQHVLPQLTTGDFSHRLLLQAAARGREHIGLLDILGVFLLHEEMHGWLREHALREEDVAFGLWWQHALADGERKKARWWDAGQMIDFSGIGVTWAAGFTPFIDAFIRLPGGSLWDVPYGHMEQVEQLTSALAREQQSNVLIVGQPGVGRLGVVKEFARRVAAGQAHPALHNQRLVYIHLSQLAALGGSGAAQMNAISRALDEMERAGNIIAVLDGLGSILGEAGEGRINIADTLLPFFSSDQVRVVVIMSTDEYHLRIKNNEELLRFFEVVHVPPLSEGQTLQLLALTSPQWERATHVFVPYRTLHEIVENTSSILPYVPFPEKAFDLLEEAIADAQGRDKSMITPADVQALVSRKVGVNVGRLKAGEGQYLLQLEEIIHRRVVNQKSGVAAVARAMIRSRAGVRSKSRPIGTFLFLGPTGVGKTETAKALAEAYFGSDEYLQRLDMSEFQGEEGVAQLIGGAQYKTGRLTSLIADHPFSVLLLDEFEKAGELVQQLFLPVFDEGFITDVRGHKHSFAHTILIATSNAGAEFIRTNISDEGEVPAEFAGQLREHILQQGLFKPEVLNRFDGVITFTPLSREHIKQIAALMLRKLNKRLDAEHGITVAVTDELLELLARIGYDPEFGARPMARAIQDTVEYAVAEQIVKGQVRPGQQLTLQPHTLERLTAQA